VPCEGGVEPLTQEEMKPYLTAVPDWKLEKRQGIDCLVRELTLAHFREVLFWVNAVGAVAEAEGHHPNLHITEYKHLCIEVYTHAIGGLSVNDFILAAKIDELLKTETYHDVDRDTQEKET